MASSRRRATSSRSSRRTTAKVEAVNPCLRAFCAERALPSGERGPVDWAALARLAASCLSVMRLGIGSFRLELWHGGGVECEIGMGQVMGGEGVRFLMLVAMGIASRRRRRGDKQTAGETRRTAAFVGRVTVSGNKRGRFQAVAPTNRTLTGELWIVEPDRIRLRVGQRLSLAQSRSMDRRVMTPIRIVGR